MRDLNATRLETAPAAVPGARSDGEPIEVSVVMPCLNEETTIASCIRKALRVFDEYGIEGEVVVADNGSTDRSVEIVESFDHRVRVVHQRIRGYGAAYLKGLAEARGRYIVMGDSDNTYDFGDLQRFLEPLRSGYDLVIGNRFAGRIHPNAMPWLHRYIGNPVLSRIMNVLYRTGIHDAHCGMRSLRRQALGSMRLRTTGMEFATEMIVNANFADLKIMEIPIDYYPRDGESKLRAIQDGWRHLRFMLAARVRPSLPGLDVVAVSQDSQSLPGPEHGHSI